MKVNWINGSINPPCEGEYYVCFEAKRDIAEFKQCDIEITGDYWDGDMWQSLGNNNPCWKVLCWARILKPDIPEDIRDRVKEYFGAKI